MKKLTEYRFLCFIWQALKTASMLALIMLFTIAKPAYANNEIPSSATKKQSIEAIHQLVESQVKQKVDQKIIEPVITIRKLPHNLELPACQNSLELNDSNTERMAGRMTFRVLCQKPKWQVFVPVIVDGKQSVIVSTQAILKGAVIEAKDIRQELIHYKKVPRGTLVQLNKAIGQRTKKAIGPNTPIKVRDLLPPFLVFKNKQVNIVTQIGEIEVVTKGIALQSGVLQDQIAVRNSSTEKTIFGIVVAPNTVLIP